MSRTTEALIRGEWPGPRCPECGANLPPSLCSEATADYLDEPAAEYRPVVGDSAEGEEG